MKTLIVSRCAWTLHNFRLPILAALVARGHEAVGAGADGDGYERLIRAAGFRFEPIPVDKKGVNPLADLRLIAALVKLYRAERPDVVHHFTIKPVIFGAFAAQRARVPRVVATITGLGYAFTSGRNGMIRRIVETLYRAALRRTDTVFFQNSDDLALFVDRKLVDQKKCVLVPGSGVDLTRFVPSQRSDNSSPYILMIARLLRDKGIIEFVEALRLLHKRGIKVHATLLGGIDARNPTAVSPEEVRAWEEEKILTWIDHVEDVRPHIAKADIVVLPSYREGVPRSLLEAAAMGKALIATDVPGCREIVTNRVNGLLVPAQNAEALADAMQLLVLDPDLRAEMGRASRQKVENEFDEKIVIERTLLVYELIG
jgi:glycosyltransferase involved in cell wall biosynthesis